MNEKNYTLKESTFLKRDPSIPMNVDSSRAEEAEIMDQVFTDLEMSDLQTWESDDIPVFTARDFPESETTPNDTQNDTIPKVPIISSRFVIIPKDCCRAEKF